MVYIILYNRLTLEQHVILYVFWLVGQVEVIFQCTTLENNLNFLNQFLFVRFIRNNPNQDYTVCTTWLRLFLREPKNKCGQSLNTMHLLLKSTTQTVCCNFIMSYLFELHHSTKRKGLDSPNTSSYRVFLKKTRKESYSWSFNFKLRYIDDVLSLIK